MSISAHYDDTNVATDKLGVLTFTFTPHTWQMKQTSV